MRIGIVTDIHSNAAALRAVLDEFSRRDAARFVCCGDIVGIGPEPEETVRTLQSAQGLLACVRGNHETYWDGAEAIGMSEGEKRHHRWQCENAGEASRAFLRTLPETATVRCGERTLYAAHYALAAQGRYAPFAPHPDERTLEAMFPAPLGDIVCYGHDHAPHIAEAGNRLFINAGALGCPMGAGGMARAVILHIEGREVRTERLCVPYDVQAVIARIRALAYPDCENILRWFYGV